MRFEVHKVRCHLVWSLQESEAVAEVTHDGHDLIVADLADGDTVVIHIVERVIPAQALRGLFDEGTRLSAAHTLLVLWSEMLLPDAGETYSPEAWMAALITLYNGQIYAYKVWNERVFVFPVRFESQGDGSYFVSYGPPLDFAHIGAATTHIGAGPLAGDWPVVDFAPRAAGASGPRGYTGAYPRPGSAALRQHYALLGLSLEADQEAIRRAYRDLARRFHPDLNAGDDDATERMQAINAAYAVIMAWWREEAER